MLEPRGLRFAKLEVARNVSLTANTADLAAEFIKSHFS